MGILFVEENDSLHNDKADEENMEEKTDGSRMELGMEKAKQWGAVFDPGPYYY